MGEIYAKIREEPHWSRDVSQGVRVSVLPLSNWDQSSRRCGVCACLNEIELLLVLKLKLPLKDSRKTKRLRHGFRIEPYDIVKTRESCQPERAREPPVTQFCRTVTSTQTADHLWKWSAISWPQCVPVKQQHEIQSGWPSLWSYEIDENNRSKWFIGYKKDDKEKAREHTVKTNANNAFMSKPAMRSQERLYIQVKHFL